MADQIKELLDKIQAEGVQAAQEKADQIEKEARSKADWIVEKANAQAAKIVEEAKETAERLQASAKAALQQAGRDAALALKKEIYAMLERLIASQVSSVLSQEQLSDIIASLIQTVAAKGDSKVIVYLKEGDRRALEGHFLGRLKDEMKKGIELRTNDDISSGFVISFDNGKSQFDFTDREIALYIGSFLKPSLAELLNTKS